MIMFFGKTRFPSSSHDRMPPVFSVSCTDCSTYFWQRIQRKHTATRTSKKPRVETSTPGIDYTTTFHTSVYQERYGCLSCCHFGESQKIDLDVLKEVILEEEVQRLLSVVVWWRLFQITDNTYEHLTLELLATFKMSRDTITFQCTDYIQFQFFDSLQQMNFTEFSVQLGLYDAEFTKYHAYDK